ncbi:hypothetical protein Y1Q_0012481 [Alligator mississippiensis]|uniref:Uncharacterized protein n=1 Tax=Alligator mississippiensis TaxID=8496 RepID=A0A151M7S8_ALLMI|nr:hypothetical protein Y1Q_0012481 [Alligator mississippiensis]
MGRTSTSGKKTREKLLMVWSAFHWVPSVASSQVFPFSCCGVQFLIVPCPVPSQPKPAAADKLRHSCPPHILLTSSCPVLFTHAAFVYIFIRVSLSSIWVSLPLSLLRLVAKEPSSQHPEKCRTGKPRGPIPGHRGRTGRLSKG